LVRSRVSKQSNGRACPGFTKPVKMSQIVRLCLTQINDARTMPP